MIDINSRIDFPQMCFDKGLDGIFVEVGVDNCDYSKEFLPGLRAGKFKKLILVDPWDPKLFWRPATRHEMNERYHKAVALGTNVKVLREKSVVASRQFVRASLDFVYIDGRHEYAWVHDDLAAWFPKIKKGGVISGHDYWMGDVKTAVDEFAAAHNLKVNTVLQHVNEFGDHSWWIDL
jgi:hypothetical protein